MISLYLSQISTFRSAHFW